MAVDDHGLEVLKKAGEYAVPGSPADYYIKVRGLGDGTVDFVVEPIDVATTPKIYNVAVGTTEVSQALSANTKRFSIQPRGTTTLNVAYAVGESSTNYIEVGPGAAYAEEGFKAASLTLYFKASKAGQIAEIIEWT